MHANLCKSNLHVLLEADGPLVLMAYTKITSTAHNTNTHAVESGGVDQMEQQLHVLAWPFLCSPVDRISKRFKGDLAPALAAFKSARLFFTHF